MRPMLFVIACGVTFTGTVRADEHPEVPNLDRTEKVSYGMGLAGLVCLALGALAFARGGRRRED